MSSWVAEAGIRVSGGPGRPGGAAVVEDGFLFAGSPWGMSHASTITAAGDRLVAAWFAGSLESRPDVRILVSVNDGSGWSAPVQAADGLTAEGGRYACWNPVLFQPARGPLLLFYKVGRSPRSWWGMWRASHDRGHTWGPAQRLPAGVLGPAKNKPVQLPDGEVLSPSSCEADGWRIHVERSRDQGLSWERGPSIAGHGLAAIQPSLLVHGGDTLQLLCRTRQRRIGESWSRDGGRSWSPLRLTSLPNPNAGTDAVTLADGRHLLVYNPSFRRRTPLVLALSADGRNWRDGLVLESGAGEYSYPAVIQTADGRVHVTYSWNLSRIRHLVIDPDRLPGPPPW